MGHIPPHLKMPEGLPEVSGIGARRRITESAPVLSTMRRAGPSSCAPTTRLQARRAIMGSSSVVQAHRVHPKQISPYVVVSRSLVSDRDPLVEPKRHWRAGRDFHTEPVEEGGINGGSICTGG